MIVTNSINQDVDENEDREAISLCIKGEKEAYGIIVKKYMKQAYFNALGIVKNHDDALDLSQEAFIQAYKFIHKFDTKRKFYTWYYKILRNLCLNHIKKNSKLTKLRKTSDEIDEEDYYSCKIIDTEADPSVLMEKNELTEKLWKAIASLKPVDREILLLKDYENCSYREISDRLEIPIGTVMSRLFNARKHLKEIFQNLI